MGGPPSRCLGSASWATIRTASCDSTTSCSASGPTGAPQPLAACLPAMASSSTDPHMCVVLLSAMISGDYLLEASRPFVHPGRFLIAGYRFNSKVEMSVNGRWGREAGWQAAGGAVGHHAVSGRPGPQQLKTPRLSRACTCCCSGRGFEAVPNERCVCGAAALGRPPEPPGEYLPPHSCLPACLLAMQGGGGRAPGLQPE